MAKPSFERLEAGKKQAILRAALEAFGAQGYEKASLGQIIEVAGISQKELDDYFADKVDLYITVLRHEMERIMVLMRVPEVTSPGGFWSALARMTQEIIGHIVEHPQTLALMHGMFTVVPEARAKTVMEELAAQSRMIMRELLIKGQGVEAVRTDLPNSFWLTVLAAMDQAGDGWFFENVKSPSTAELNRWGAISVDLLRRLLSPTVEFPPE